MWLSFKKFIKYFFLVFFILFIGFIAFNFDAAVYGFRQAKGQLKIIFNTRPVKEVMEDKTFPDSLKKRIELIQEIKRFAVDSLGLNLSENYTTFYDQHHKPILWVMTACEPFELKAKKWRFPIVGAFSYKGYFEKELADKEITELKKQGFDTQLNEVSAWSTLGYLKDPILSSMLYYSDARLAALIIHELTHGTLFVKNNLEFNENLADFIGEYGAIRFLAYKHGKDSGELKKYELSKKFGDSYTEHLIRGAKLLDSLYRNFNKNLTITQKTSEKFDLIQKIMASTDTLMKGEMQSLRKNRNRTSEVNNAYFIGYLTYQSKQNQFEEEFRTKFNQDFKKYLAYLKKAYPSSIVF
ncbi:aminopeptidase [Emticicia sp. BO119]|uniref:aminopeptidase n=1 Tax=Emticicia sp. BO119 TaxID=2757768 RepID=UPI0015F058E3|nr:aminopeptidase [Emticicia sp. BO119]MBA4853267.1 aminopeptidase [Emticicia sp. BO119]